MFRGRPPPAVTTSTTATLWNAIIVWSGDHLGNPGATFIEVSWNAFDPSGSLTHNSGSPERSETNTSRRPSGVRLGPMSCRVDAIAAAGSEVAGVPGRAMSTRHTFLSSRDRTYTSRRPPGTRDTTGDAQVEPPAGPS